MHQYKNDIQANYYIKMLKNNIDIGVIRANS